MYIQSGIFNPPFWLYRFESFFHCEAENLNITFAD